MGSPGNLAPPKSAGLCCTTGGADSRGFFSPSPSSSSISSSTSATKMMGLDTCSLFESSELPILVTRYCLGILSFAGSSGSGELIDPWVTPPPSTNVCTVIGGITLLELSPGSDSPSSLPSGATGGSGEEQYRCQRKSVVFVNE